MKIKRYSSHIKENIDSTNDLTKLTELIEDCFLDFCDTYKLEIYIQKGFFVNDNFMSDKMIDITTSYIKKVGLSNRIFPAYHVNFYKKHDEWGDAEVGNKENIKSINSDFTNCKHRLKYLAANILKRDFNITKLNKEIEPHHLQISFYMTDITEKIIEI